MHRRYGGGAWSARWMSFRRRRWKRPWRRTLGSAVVSSGCQMIRKPGRQRMKGKSDWAVTDHSRLIQVFACSCRTETPIKVAHEFVLQVFFSVDGEDLTGHQINDGDPSGVMRMLVLPIPVSMPSVSAAPVLHSVSACSRKPLLNSVAALSSV
jgi:hypothetical protein